MMIKHNRPIIWISILSILLEKQAKIEAKRFGELKTLDSSNKVSQHAWVQGLFVKSAKTWAVFLASVTSKGSCSSLISR